MAVFLLDLELAPQVLDPGQQRVDLLGLFTGGGPGPEPGAVDRVLDGVAVALERGDHLVVVFMAPRRQQRVGGARALSLKAAPSAARASSRFETWRHSSVVF